MLEHNDVFLGPPNSHFGHLPREGQNSHFWGSRRTAQKALSMMINNNIINMFIDVIEHKNARVHTFWTRFLRFVKTEWKFSNPANNSRKLLEITPLRVPGWRGGPKMT